jgi:hypothetical protein
VVCMEVVGEWGSGGMGVGRGGCREVVYGEGQLDLPREDVERREEDGRAVQQGVEGVQLLDHHAPNLKFFVRVWRARVALSPSPTPAGSVYRREWRLSRHEPTRPFSPVRNRKLPSSIVLASWLLSGRMAGGRYD